MAEPISARQRAILTAILENYIETGEPVGSGPIAGTIARVQVAEGGGAGLSSATVRNEMAELAMAGLLEQPHTSAGRAMRGGRCVQRTDRGRSWSRASNRVLPEWREPMRCWSGPAMCWRQFRAG